MHICRQCNKEKDDTDFYKDDRNNNGLRSICKICHNENALAWRRRNPTLISRYNKEYYNSHKGDVDAEDQER